MPSPGLIAVRVRGIYATAVASILLDEGMLLADLSDVLRSRINVPEARTPPHVTVKSLDDSPDELLIIGYPWDAGVRVEESIVNRIKYASVRRGRLGLYTVVDAVSEGDCRVRLPEGILGRLDESECPGEGEAVRATVVKESLEPGTLPTLKLGVKLVGSTVIVSYPGEGVSFSEHLSYDKRAELLSVINERVNVKEFHVRVRSGAKLTDPGRVAEEAEALAARARELASSKPSSEPSVIARGEYISIVYVSSEAKRILDGYRSKLHPTVTLHHSLKASGHTESMLVDFAEECLKEGGCSESSGYSILSFIASKLRGRRVSITHRTPDGRVIRLGPFSVDAVQRSEDSVRLVLSREFRTPGVLDGLNVEKRPGDRSRTIIDSSSWTVIHEYISSDGRLLGVYANINTPPEIGLNGIRYLDLYIDVVKRPGESASIIDRDKLEEARDKGFVTDELYSRALSEAERTKNILDSTYP